MTRVFKRSWLATVLCLMLLVSLVTPVLAETPLMTRDEAIEFLRSYRIVEGDEHGNLNLDQTLTRAQLAKIAVVAVGKGDLAPALAEVVRFTDDSKGHWAAGYIEMAARMDLIKGRTATSFDPDAPVTYAEALTIVLRMVGHEPSGPWNGVRIMQAAADLNIGPKISLDALAGIPAQRGAIFESLAQAVTSVPLPDGKTVASKHLDADPPRLTLSTIPSSTAFESITVAGTVEGAHTVTINGESATITGNRFSRSVQLQVGENTIKVVATDRAGNRTTETRAITRGGDVAAIGVNGPTSVKAGESVTLTVRPADAAGNLLPASLLTATVADNMGSFNVETGLFTAGNQAGKATITFVSGDASQTYELNVVGLAADAHSLRFRPVTGKIPTVGRSTTLQVEVLDETGNPITYDDGRLIMLSSSTQGVSMTDAFARTVDGVATFTVSSSVDGDSHFTTSSDRLVSGSQTITFATSTRVVLVADPTSAAADGSTPITIRAVLQNEAGTAVTNGGTEDILIQISEASDESMLTNSTLRVRRGASSSVGYDGFLIPGFKTETVRVTGTISSGQKYTIVPAEVSLKEIVIGTATKLELLGGYGYPTPGLASPVTLTVRVTDKDGNFVPNADVAFQVKVTTSNDDVLVDGIPTGVDLTLGTTALRPISGYSDGVIARTTNGTAQLTLTYVRSGRVTVELVPVQGSDSTYDVQGVSGRAGSSTGMTMPKRDILFADTVTAMKVLVDLPSSRLTNQLTGVLPANGRATATVKVTLVDGADGWVPNSGGTVTLTRTIGTGTRLSGATPDTYTAIVRNGVAEFTILATNTASSDTWTASSSLLGTAVETIDIHTYSAAPGASSILVITGEAGELNRVLASDDYMVVDLANASGYGFVKVYRSGSNTPIYTSDVIDLASNPSVQVPRASLPSADRYYVVVNNGYWDSVKSELWPTDPTQKVISEKALKLNISRVRYDAATRKLYVTVTGVNALGVVDPSLLSIRNTVTGAVEYLTSATCVPATSSFTCELPYELNAADFNGSVVLDTEAGWYRRDSAGESAQRDETLSDNLLNPMAYVNYATVEFSTVNVSGVDHVTGTLILHGTNLNQGRIYLSELTIGGYAMGAATQSAPTGTSTRVTIKIPDYSNTTSKSEADSIAAKIMALPGPNVTLEGGVGWLKATTGDQNGSMIAIPVYTATKITKIQYVADTDGNGDITLDGGKILIYGSGFLTATVDPNNLVFTDRRGSVITSLALTLYTQITVASDTLIEVTLTEADAADLENPANSHNGNVYLTSVETTFTNGSWYANADGWYGVTLPRYRLSW